MGLEEAEKMKGEDPCWPNYEMIGTKPGKDGEPVPNCVLKKSKKAKSKNEEVEIVEAKVGDTVSFHHELKSAPGSKVKKSGTVEKVDGDVVHVKVKDKYGVKRHQIKMGDLVKEETELGEELDFKKEAAKHMKDVNSPNVTQAVKQYAAKMVRRALEASRMKDKEAAHKHYMGEEDVKEDTEQIDELNKDTVYSYNKKADADVEKKHKSLGQLMRRGDAAGANKAAHQINRRLAGMERAEKRLNTEEVEQIDEISAEVKQKYLAAATKKHLQQFLGRAPVRDKPVDPKNLVVSLKDVPVKKPRGHTQYDPSKEFPGVKALKREETELEEAEAKKVRMTPGERAYKRKIGKKAVAEPVSEASKVETAAQVTKHFEKGQSTPSGVPKWVAEPVDNPKLADKFMKAFRKMKTAANVSCKTYGTVSTCEETELDEAAKAKMKGDPSQAKNVKKGEPLSGKQEPVKLNPELQEK